MVVDWWPKQLWIPVSPEPCISHQRKEEIRFLSHGVAVCTEPSQCVQEIWRPRIDPSIACVVKCLQVLPFLSLHDAPKIVDKLCSILHVSKQLFASRVSIKCAKISRGKAGPSVWRQNGFVGSSNGDELLK